MNCLQAVLTNNNKGRADLTNLPRKINICVSPTRDDFPHTHINDLGFQAVKTESGELRFNVEVGGYFSIKRNAVSFPLGISVSEDQVRCFSVHFPCPSCSRCTLSLLLIYVAICLRVQLGRATVYMYLARIGKASVLHVQVVPFSEALMLAFRDHGDRTDRQKARLMWLVEKLGAEEFTKLVGSYMDNAEFGPEVHPNYPDVWKRRDILGVHPQKQEGLSWVRPVPAFARSLSHVRNMSCDMA